MKYNLGFIGSKSTDVVALAKKENEVGKQLSFTQDAVHVATKLRNRLLKPSSIYPMGNAQVSVSHLKMLISHFSKDIHGLVMSDVCPEDRQNYSAFEKVTSPHILNRLHEHIVGSEATATYLEMSRAICSSFVENDLSPQERVERTWHALYFFRAWRVWIKQSNTYDLEKNFVSSMEISCMEINAFALLHLIIKFRDEDRPDLFLPTLFTSQTCEKTFRQMRSMTSINWTRINFSLLELFHIASRIELINDIVYYKLDGKSVVFPRIQNNSEVRPTFFLLTDDEIRNILHHAQQKALADASKLGMHLELSDIMHCPLTQVSLKEFPTVHNQSEEEEILTEVNSLSCNSLRDYTRHDMQIDGDSKFIQVFNDDGSSKYVLKSSVLWLLTNSKEKLSKDRLIRVRGAATPQSTSRKRKLSPQTPLQQEKKQKCQILHVAEDLQIGDWCFFWKQEIATDPEFETCIDNIVIGAITGFKYIKGKNERDRQYSLNFAPVKSKDAGRGVEVSATWFNLDKSLKLTPINYCHFFININNYVATTLSPIHELSSNSYRVPVKTDEIIEELHKLLK